MKKAIAIALAAAGAVILVKGRYDLRLANRAKALLDRKSIFFLIQTIGDS